MRRWVLNEKEEWVEITPDARPPDGAARRRKRGWLPAGLWPTGYPAWARR